mgnify:CR=1 FL=1
MPCVRGEQGDVGELHDAAVQVHAHPHLRLERIVRGEALRGEAQVAVEQGARCAQAHAGDADAPRAHFGAAAELLQPQPAMVPQGDALQLGEDGIALYPQLGTDDVRGGHVHVIEVHTEGDRRDVRIVETEMQAPDVEAGAVDAERSAPGGGVRLPQPVEQVGQVAVRIPFGLRQREARPVQFQQPRAQSTLRSVPSQGAHHQRVHVHQRIAAEVGHVHAEQAVRAERP